MASGQDEWLRSLPPEVSAFGVPEQVHPVRPSALWLCRLTALACLAIAAGLLLFLSDPLPATGRPHGEVLIAGAAFAAASLVLIGMSFSLRTFAYLVFPEALVQVFGCRYTIFRWDDITEVFEQPIGARSRFRIVLSDGRVRTVAPVVRNQQALGRAIVARVSERVLPRTLRFLEKGGTVALGGLSISAERIPCRHEERACARIIQLDRRAQTADERHADERFRRLD
jgi:hypothetical protein